MDGITIVMALICIGIFGIAAGYAGISELGKKAEKILHDKKCEIESEKGKKTLEVFDKKRDATCELLKKAKASQDDIESVNDAFDTWKYSYGEYILSEYQCERAEGVLKNTKISHTDPYIVGGLVSGAAGSIAGAAAAIRTEQKNQASREFYKRTAITAIKLSDASKKTMEVSERKMKNAISEINSYLNEYKIYSKAKQKWDEVDTWYSDILQEYENQIEATRNEAYKPVDPFRYMFFGGIIILVLSLILAPIIL